MMAVSEIKADTAAIQAHLRHITARWGELEEPCVFEVRLLSSDDNAVVKNVSRYTPDEMGINFAADHIAAMNQHNLNAYVVVNPISAAAHIEAGKAAKDEHIVGSLFHWADADDAQAAENIKSFVGPRPTYFVLTGTQPCARPHVYWELEEPTRNLTAWNATQKAIAATLKTDAAVVNPSRIMRIAGTVNWPKPKKQAKGYVQEVTSLRIYEKAERPLVTSERMARAFVAPASPPHDGFHIDTGAQQRSAEHYADILRRARTDGEKHGGVRDLAAALAGASVPRHMAEAIIREACPVWDAGVEKLIETAYAKFYQSEAEPQFDAPKVDASDLFKPWVPLNPLLHPRRDFIYGKHYIRKFASVTVAPGGLGKSSLVLAECIAIATGRPILGITPRTRERVVYFNAEDPREEIERRVLAICQHHQIDQSELTEWFYFQSGRDLNLILSAGDDGKIIEPVFELMENFAAVIKPGVFAFDPLANMTEAPETNDVFRRLGKRISQMADKLDCSVELVHHTRKLNGNEATVEDSRGGSALIGAVRAGRVLNPMTSDEAVKAGLETHIDHFRIEAAGKNNLSRGDERSTWLRRVDVEIANGEHVAAVSPWDWPDAFDGVTKDDAARVQAAIAGLAEDPPRASVQSAKWAGHVVARVMDMDSDDKAQKARINSLIKGWIKSGVLALDKMHDSRNGRETSIVIAGPNNPKSEVSA